jgi:hypothetical protein
VGGWRLDASGSGWAPVAGCCGRGGEPSGSIGGGEFLYLASQEGLCPMESVTVKFQLICNFRM